MTNRAFELIGLNQLRNDSRFAGIDGSGVSVAVLDSGIDRNHSLIASNYAGGYDFVDFDNNPNDSSSHGTHVAGIIGAKDPNIGIAPDVDLIGLKIVPGTADSLKAGLEWILDNRDRYNIVAANLSLGFGSLFLSDETIATNGGVFNEINFLLDQLEAAGVTTVTAAGNAYYSEQVAGVAFPAISSTINVGAVWQDDANSSLEFNDGAMDYSTGADRIASFSQRLDDPNDVYDTLFAPGAMITSTAAGGGTYSTVGTSQAAPHVTGAIALMQEAALQFGDRLLSPSEVSSILFSTADTIYDGDDEDDNVANTNTNYARLNVYQAVAEVEKRFENISQAAVNTPPQKLLLESSQQNGKLNLTSWVKDPDGYQDVARVDLWLLLPNGQWQDIADIKDWTSWNKDPDWACNNTYQLDLNNLNSGQYRLWGRAYDHQNESDAEASITFKLESQIQTSSVAFDLSSTSYLASESLNFSTLTATESAPIDSIDLWLLLPNGQWQDVSDINDREDLIYQLDLTDLPDGSYGLWGKGYNFSGLPVSETLTRFEIIKDPLTGSQSSVIKTYNYSDKTEIVELELDLDVNYRASATPIDTITINHHDLSWAALVASEQDVMTEDSWSTI